MGSPATLPVAAPASALNRELDELTRLDLPDLRVRWRKLMRTAPPDHLPRSLLLRVLAYKLQARAFGDLDPSRMRTVMAGRSGRTRAASRGRTRHADACR
jgi:hypothetical protein